MNGGSKMVGSSLLRLPYIFIISIGEHMFILILFFKLLLLLFFQLLLRSDKNPEELVLAFDDMIGENDFRK